MRIEPDMHLGVYSSLHGQVDHFGFADHHADWANPSRTWLSRYGPGRPPQLPLSWAWHVSVADIVSCVVKKNTAQAALTPAVLHILLALSTGSGTGTGS